MNTNNVPERNILNGRTIPNKGWSDHDSSFTNKLQQVADEFNQFIQTKDKPTNLEDFIRKHTDLVGDPLDDMIEKAKKQARDSQGLAQSITPKTKEALEKLVAKELPKPEKKKDSLSEVIRTRKDADDFMRQLDSLKGSKPERTEQQKAFDDFMKEFTDIKNGKPKQCGDKATPAPLGFQVGPTKAEEIAHEATQKAAERGGVDPARGLRYNSGKTLYNLIPPYPLEQIAKVFTKGAEKYAPNNWKKGMPWSEVEGSLMRHFEAYRAGEDFDDESKLYHMAHVAVNAMFILDYYRSNPKFDDRYKSYMQKPRIVLDIDEVLCGWAAGYKAWTGKDIQATYWDSRYGFTKELAELAKNKEFWLSLPCIRKPDFVPHAYVSSRSIPVEWTQEWLEKNGLPCRPVHHVPFDHSKIEILKSLSVDYFVDDRFENFFEAEQAGICTFLMDASHNQHYHVGFKRIHDLKIKNIVR